MDIRQIIKDRMEQRGITQLDLQALTGVLQHRISEYLSGRRDVHGETLQKLLEALNLEVKPAKGRGKGR